MWHKGYTHYHTSFHYPKGKRLTPQKLAVDLRKTGAEFVFCAGDHGTFEGDNYWGLDIREFDAYKEFCGAASTDCDFLFVPTPEIHLMFPPFGERHEHHSCIPILDYRPKLEPPETRSLAASFTRDVGKLITDTHQRGIALTMNHPYMSFNSAFGGPNPLHAPELYAVDYFELATLGGEESYFPNDFKLYLAFLANPKSQAMACCGGVDNACHPDWLLSGEKGIIPATYLFTPAETSSSEDIMAAWNRRKSYMAYGDLRIEQIAPVPGGEFIETNTHPVIKMSFLSRKKITELEIYRNGQEVYKGGDISSWRDDNPLPGENRYIVHLTAENEHLVTSPINYRMK